MLRVVQLLAAFIWLQKCNLICAGSVGTFLNVVVFVFLIRVSCNIILPMFPCIKFFKISSKFCLCSCILTFYTCSKRISGFDMAPPVSAMLAGATAAGTLTLVDIGLYILLTAFLVLV